MRSGPAAARARIEVHATIHAPNMAGFADLKFMECGYRSLLTFVALMIGRRRFLISAS
jgi:hypothetical protein